MLELTGLIVIVMACLGNRPVKEKVAITIAVALVVGVIRLLAE